MPPRPKNKKSLAEELAELANPAPQTDIDPDADIFQSGPTLEASDDELMDAVRQSNNRPATRSSKRAAAADIILEGPEYAGKKASSKSIFGDEDSDDENEDENEDEDDLHQNGMNGLHKQTANSSSDDDEDEEEAGEDREGSSSDEEEEDEMARLEREYRDLQAAETNTVKQLQDRVSKERRKAVAVSNQTNIWKKALEARILLQKSLSGGNRLPRGKAYNTAVEHSEKVGVALKSLASEASETLSSVCDVLEALMQRNPAVAEAQAAAGVVGGSKRKRDDDDNDDEDEDEDDVSASGWKRLEGCYKEMQPFRDSSVDRWHRKTVLQSGTAAVRGNLRVLNQSVSTQIATMMADPSRLVQRTRVVKGSVKTLCEPAAVVMNNKVSSSMSDYYLLL